MSGAWASGAWAEGAWLVGAWGDIAVEPPAPAPVIEGGGGPDEDELEKHLLEAGKAGRRIYEVAQRPAAGAEIGPWLEPAKPLRLDELEAIEQIQTGRTLPEGLHPVQRLEAAPRRPTAQDMAEEELLIKLLLTSNLRRDSEDEELAIVLAVAELT